MFMVVVYVTLAPGTSYRAIWLLNVVYPIPDFQI